MSESPAFYQAAEKRIERLTLVVGGLAALAAGLLWGARSAAGILLGAALAWLNYRWLKQGLTPLARLAAAQQEAPQIKVPASVYWKFAGRYALIAAVLYVIFAYSLLPGVAVLGGLFALAAAVVVELLFQLTQGIKQTG